MKKKKTVFGLGIMLTMTMLLLLNVNWNSYNFFRLPFRCIDFNEMDKQCLSNYFNHSFALKTSDLKKVGKTNYKVPCGKKFKVYLQYTWHNYWADFEDYLKGRSCAVMGSSGALVGSGYGREIDRHDRVFRFGYASYKKHTEDFIEDVGNKTSLQIMNPSVLDNDFEGVASNAVADYFVFNTNMCVDNMKYAYIKRFIRDRSKFLVRSFLWNLELDSLLKLFDPTGDIVEFTSGMTYSILALANCKTVDLYGFWPFIEDCNGNKVRYHYWDNGTIDQTKNFRIGKHNYTKEFQLISNLENMFPGYFQLHNPENYRCIKDPEMFDALKKKTDGTDVDYLERD